MTQEMQPHGAHCTQVCGCRASCVCTAHSAGVAQLMVHLQCFVSNSVHLPFPFPLPPFVFDNFFFTSNLSWNSFFFTSIMPLSPDTAFTERETIFHVLIFVVFYIHCWHYRRKLAEHRCEQFCSLRTRHEFDVEVSHRVTVKQRVDEQKQRIKKCLN